MLHAPRLRLFPLVQRGEIFLIELRGLFDVVLVGLFLLAADIPLEDLNGDGRRQLIIIAARVEIDLELFTAVLEAMGVAEAGLAFTFKGAVT
ncbi:MAG: hypothetical protein KAI47_12580 [Deltaproteobacteria bacterium]|nr:hypothetical protein [Deltaproteobacteria bacterium]